MIIFDYINAPNIETEHSQPTTIFSRIRNKKNDSLANCNAWQAGKRLCGVSDLGARSIAFSNQPTHRDVHLAKQLSRAYEIRQLGCVPSEWDFSKAWTCLAFVMQMHVLRPKSIFSRINSVEQCNRSNSHTRHRPPPPTTCLHHWIINWMTFFISIRVTNAFQNAQ